MAMGRCPSCGVENEDIARFCRSCGAKLEENEYEDEKSREPSIAIPTIVSGQAASSDGGKNTVRILIALGAGIVVLLLLIPAITRNKTARPLPMDLTAQADGSGQTDNGGQKYEYDEHDDVAETAYGAETVYPLEEASDDMQNMPGVPTDMAAGASDAQYEMILDGYILENVDSRYYSANEIMERMKLLQSQGYSMKDALRLARNECYAIYGNVFRDFSLNIYFYDEHAEYYTPNPNITPEEIVQRYFNDYIAKNIETIQELEAYYS